ncbi:MAG: hypothetical protein ACOCP8_02155 [archaeon]
MDKSRRDLEIFATIINVWKKFKKEIENFQECKETTIKFSSDIKSQAEKEKIEKYTDLLLKEDIINY